MQYDRVVFNLPGTNLFFHNGRVQNPELDIYVTDAVGFVQSVVVAVRQWLVTVAENQTVQINLQNVVQIRPQGNELFRGIPIIS